MASRIKPGVRVRVPWGLDEDREGVVVEVWGDPALPSQIRVELLPLEPDEDPVLLLLGPSVVTPTSAA